MPTIGREDYSTTDRVPIRDERGTLRQDALRRDLTVGSMYIHVSKCTTASPSCSPHSTADHFGMQYVLKDFYGGLSDLQNRILRAPHPSILPLSDLTALVMSRDDQERASAIGLDLNDPQQMWWIKVLRDDPLRIIRILRCTSISRLLRTHTFRHCFCSIRFAAKLDFSIHASFWSVVPFALDDLSKKVCDSI
jgi:hypothetical protein